MMTRQRLRNLRLLGMALLDLGAGVILGVALGLAALTQVLQQLGAL
jgi:hypothetical protein